MIIIYFYNYYVFINIVKYRARWGVLKVFSNLLCTKLDQRKTS